MEIAIGVVFLTLFAGAFFLFVLITGFYFWRRSKRKNAGQIRQFSSTGSQSVENDSLDDDEHQGSLQESNLAYAHQQYSSDSFQHSPGYAESSNENSKMETGNFEAAASMSYESPSEGGDYASSGSDNSTNYESSSSYNSSSSSSDSSSSSSDSGSSSSSSSSSSD